MDKGMITHTILHYAEGMVTGLSTVAFINVMYWLEVVLSFLVPSSSGLAVLTMPIMAPCRLANVNRDLVVTAYQSASGIVNSDHSHSFCRCDGRTGYRPRALRAISEMGRAAAWDINSGNYGGIKSGGIAVICRMALPLSGLWNVVSPVISRTEYRIMMDYVDFSPKEQLQLTVCQRLIAEKSYFSQEELRRDLQERGFETISQSTVSRLLKLLGVIKIRNASAKSLFAESTVASGSGMPRTVSEMVVSVEHNREFILIHTVVGYGRAVARVLDYHQLPEILGVVAGSSIVWVAPRIQRVALVHKQINYLLRTY